MPAAWARSKEGKTYLALERITQGAEFPRRNCTCGVSSHATPVTSFPAHFSLRSLHSRVRGSSGQ